MNWAVVVAQSWFLGCGFVFCTTCNERRQRGCVIVLNSKFSFSGDDPVGGTRTTT